MRVPLLKVSAEPSSNIDLSNSPRALYDQYGITHILEASLEEIGNTLFVDVGLTESRLGFRFWSEIFEFEQGEQGYDFERVIVDIVRMCEPQLHKSIYDSVVALDGELGPYTLYLKASSMLAMRGWNAQSFADAADLLRRSLELKPDFSHAAAYLSLLLAFGHRIGILERDAALVQEVEDTVEKALGATLQDSTVLGFVGCALCDISQQARGEPLLRRAVTLNKANAQAWAALGASQLMSGAFDTAIEYLERGVTISPLDSRLSVWRSLLALAYFVSGQLVPAEQAAKMACEDDDKTYMPRVVLAGIHIKTRHLPAAQAAKRDALRVKPDLSEQEVQALIGKKLSEAFFALH
jgi:Tfp pilus assembly protein PilF